MLRIIWLASCVLWFSMISRKPKWKTFSSTSPTNHSLPHLTLRLNRKFFISLTGVFSSITLILKITYLKTSSSGLIFGMFYSCFPRFVNFNKMIGVQSNHPIPSGLLVCNYWYGPFLMICFSLLVGRCQI